MGLEAYRYGTLCKNMLDDVLTLGIELSTWPLSACNVKWLGIRGDDLQHIPLQSLIQLKPWDLQIAKSLLSADLLQVAT